MSDPKGVVERALEQGPPDEIPARELVRARMRQRLFGANSEPVSIGRYSIRALLGQGSHGVVYAAHDDRLERDVALKVLKTETRRGPGKARERLIAEAKALAKLAHPNIVTVYEIFADASNDVVVAMELVEGPTLRAWVMDSRPTATQILAKYIEAGRGLAAAHAAGMVHRDFKPSNVIIGSDGRVRVLDFGLARLVGPEQEGHERSLEAEGSPLLLASTASEAPSRTNRSDRTGIVGTPLYMAPEQHDARPADARSDQYAYCASLWEALTGEPPFAGSTVPELRRQKLLRAVQRPRDAALPRHIRLALERGLSSNPDDRFASMDELLCVLEPEARQRRRIWWSLAAAGTLAFASLVHGAWNRGTSCDGAGIAVYDHWTPKRRKQLERRFSSVDLPFAGDSWRTTLRLLERWALRWDDAAQASCSARVRSEQSARMLDLRDACLHRHLVAFESLLGVFEEADATVVTRSVDATRSLPDVASCVEQPATPSAVGRDGNEVEHESIRRRLSRARASVATGRYAEALELTRAVLHELDEAQWRDTPLRAEALLVHGDACAWAGKSADALEAFREAVLLAHRIDTAELFVRGATDLVWEYGDSRSEFGVAHTWADLAQASLRVLGGHPTLAARLHNNLGAVLTQEQRYDEALAQHRARLELVGPDDGDAFISWANIGNIHNHRGRWEAADEAYRRAIELGSADLGPTHPKVLSVRATMLGVAWRIESPEHAHELGERLLDDLGSVYDDPHPDFVIAYSNLANIEAARGDYEASLQYGLRGLEHAEAVYGPDAPPLLSVLLGLARSLLARGDVEQARSQAERALSIAQQSRGEAHGDTAYARAGLGRVELHAGAVERSVKLLDQALTVATQSAAPDELVAQIHSDLALARADLDSPAAALEHARSALRLGGVTEDRIVARARLARALVDLGRFEEALERLDPLIAESRERPSKPALADALFDRMRARYALDRRQPEPNAARALVEQESDAAVTPRLLARMRAWGQPSL